MSPKLRWFLPLCAAALALDQASKQAVLRGLEYGERIEVIPGFFHLTHVVNPGGAWSFLADSPPAFRLPFFFGATVLGVLVVLHYVRRLGASERLSAAALGTILGGVLGNLWDRVAHGGVVDMLDFTLFGGYEWPTFNLADSFIVVGVAVLFLEVFLGGAEASGRAGAGAAASSERR